MEAINQIFDTIFLIAGFGVIGFIFLVVALASSEPDRIRTGPRGGRYRINKNGRKSYDVD